MTEIAQYIKPERQGLWAVAAFILALMALGVALVGLIRIQELGYMSQAQVLMLNKKIDEVKGPVAPPMPAVEQKEMKE